MKKERRPLPLKRNAAASGAAARSLAGFLFFLTAAGLSAVSPRAASAAVFSQTQMEEISCAGVEMQLFYYYFAPNREAQLSSFKLECRSTPSVVKMPAWIDRALPAMISRKVWRDPDEGDISEAALWQTSVSILYEFFDLTKKTFPPSAKGAGIQPGLLVKEYADVRVRFQMALDRVYRARLSDSMEGRGRAILSMFDLMLKEMESISDAISSTNSQQYAQSVTAIAVLSQDAFGQLVREPRGRSGPESGLPGKILPLVLKILGMLVVFLGVRLVFYSNENRISSVSQEYIKKISQWTEDFNRQFMQVKVQYLVMVPAGLFMLAGILTFTFTGFLFFTGVGIYLGLRVPGKVLDFMKQRRGKRVDAQLMDALILLSNSLRSGLDIVQGFEMVSKDLTPPISDEFGLVIRNYQLGTPFEKALGGMEERVASRLLSYMLRAIILQRQVGGNLTKIFERIVENIREEGKLEEKTKSLTAQQKIQSMVVGIMPWIMLFVMFLFQGQLMARFYFSPIGMLTLLLCMIWIGIGMKIVQSLGNIRV